MAREQFSASQMNNSKWRELVDAVEGITTGGFRVKLIDDDQVWETDWIISPSPSYMEGESIGPVLFIAIEWLEILPAEPRHIARLDDQSANDERCQRLRRIGIPFTEDLGVLRIVGHFRA
jgi:hypothetical protein